jgi:hypothetical protein
MFLSEKFISFVFFFLMDFSFALVTTVPLAFLTPPHRSQVRWRNFVSVIGLRFNVLAHFPSFDLTPLGFTSSLSLTYKNNNSNSDDDDDDEEEDRDQDTSHI